MGLHIEGLAWYPKSGKRWGWEELPPFSRLRLDCSVVHRIARQGRPGGFQPTKEMPWWATRPGAMFRWFAARELQEFARSRAEVLLRRDLDPEKLQVVCDEMLPWLLAFGDPAKVFFIFDFV